jgi:hypothetical protein
MNKSVVLGVAWMERGGIREGGAENPGLHPGYGDFVVLARLDERAQRSRVLTMTIPRNVTLNLLGNDCFVAYGSSP